MTEVTEQAKAAALKFGDKVECIAASDDNPGKFGFFVRSGRNSGRVNTGPYVECTDGKGYFWRTSPDNIRHASPHEPTAGTERAKAALEFWNDNCKLCNGDHTDGDYLHISGYPTEEIDATIRKALSQPEAQAVDVEENNSEMPDQIYCGWNKEGHVLKQHWAYSLDRQHKYNPDGPYVRYIRANLVIEREDLESLKRSLDGLDNTDWNINYGFNAAIDAITASGHLQGSPSTRKEPKACTKAEPEEHCKDCCCARSWKALGVTGYTGKSISEHIEELVAEREQMAGAIRDLTADSNDFATSYADSFKKHAAIIEKCRKEKTT